MKASIILATYKEKENIVSLIKALFDACKKEKIQCEIIVVDDNSPDHTADAVKKEYGKNKRVKLIVRKNERGLATAILRGIRESKHDTVVFMDTDFSHDPKLVPKLIKLTKKYDIASGSRYVKDGKLKTDFHRTVITFLEQFYVRFMIGSSITDYTLGFLAIKKSLLNNLDLDKIFYGYGDYCIRLFHHAKKSNAQILEIPAIYKNREQGESKTKVIKHSIQYFFEVLKLRFS
jgi:dolichol-phosphate mannosyltransferase